MIQLTDLRRRLDVQGFFGLSDQDIQELGPWMRFTPAMNASIAAIGTFAGSLGILLSLAFFMGIGAMVPLHPFDFLYNKTVRFLTRTKPLPSSGPRRRFVFGIECWWLLITTWLFTHGYFGWAVSMGWLLAAVVLTLAMSHICLISELLQKISRKPDGEKV